MLYRSLLLLKGDGHAVLKCKTQPHVETRVGYDLRDLPLGGTLLVGDGTSSRSCTPLETRGEWVLEPMAPDTLWAAYLSEREGRCLAWGAADGRWHEYVAAAIYAYHEERVSRVENTSPEEETPSSAPTDTPSEETPSPSVDLASFGVVEIRTEESRTIDAVREEDPIAPAEWESAPSSGEAISESAGPIPEASETTTEAVEAAPGVGETMASVTEEAAATSPDTDRQPMFSAEVEDLMAAFDAYPPYTPLMTAIAGSRWVEVREEGGAYLLGVLYDSTPLPTHLVYGVRGWRDRPFSPEAEWLPLGEAEDPNEGYWLIYHNL